MSQRRQEGGNGAKLREKIMSVSFSEEQAASKAAVLMVEACGAAPFPLQTPDAAHANAVLLT